MADVYECYSNIRYNYRLLNNYWGEAQAIKQDVGNGNNTQESYEYYQHYNQQYQLQAQLLVFYVLRLVLVLSLYFFFVMDIVNSKKTLGMKLLHLLLLNISLPIYAAVRIAELKKK